MTALERLRRMVEEGNEFAAPLTIASHALARAMVSEEVLEKVVDAAHTADIAHAASFLRKFNSPQTFEITTMDIGAAVRGRYVTLVRAALEALAQLANPDQDTRGES
jgi:adenosylcobinamide amidohydrolase